MLETGTTLALVNVEGLVTTNSDPVEEAADVHIAEWIARKLFYDTTTHWATAQTERK